MGSLGVRVDRFGFGGRRVSGFWASGLGGLGLVAGFQNAEFRAWDSLGGFGALAFRGFRGSGCEASWGRRDGLGSVGVAHKARCTRFRV